MTYSTEEITRRLQLGEDCADIADEIAAFANADGGTLLCGVTDEGEGQDMTRERLSSLDDYVV